jgi:hypothetical protein
MPTVSEVFKTRRELLRYGGLGLAGASLNSIWPLRVSAAEHGRKVTPRCNARNVIFYEISGAISHVESFDFKENPSTPKDFKVEKLSTGVYFPTNFFPRISKIMDRVAIMRSFVSHEEVHLRGQYYVQAGRPLNVAFAKEIPSVGSVVAAELESRRRENDTFPTYVPFSISTRSKRSRACRSTRKRSSSSKSAGAYYRVSATSAASA